jgi:hypothetical protein
MVYRLQQGLELPECQCPHRENPAFGHRAVLYMVSTRLKLRPYSDLVRLTAHLKGRQQGLHLQAGQNPACELRRLPGQDKRRANGHLQDRSREPGYSFGNGTVLG